MNRTGANVCNLLNPDHRGKIIQRAIDKLKDHDGEFEAIAFRGLSGSVMASILANQLGKSLIAVRKEGEPSHSANRQIEHWLPSVEDKSKLTAIKWIILDDSIATGRTVREIYQKVTGNGFSAPVGLMCYADGAYAYGENGKYKIYDVSTDPAQAPKVLAEVRYW